MDTLADATPATRELIARALTAVSRHPSPERVRTVQRLRDDFLHLQGAAQAGKLTPTQAQERTRKLGERAQHLLDEVQSLTSR